MSRQTFFFSLLVITAGLLFMQTTQAEARSHSRSRSSVHVNVGTRCNDAYIVRRYAHPVAVPTVIYAAQPIYNPYFTPVYAYQAPVYMEEVYSVPSQRSIGFGGLSFSWNFFK